VQALVPSVFKQADCLPFLSTVFSNRCSKTRLYVDESPLVTSHDIAVGVEKISGALDPVVLS
jgi:hypothetical protein